MPDEGTEPYLQRKVGRRRFMRMAVAAGLAPMVPALIAACTSTEEGESVVGASPATLELDGTQAVNDQFTGTPAPTIGGTLHIGSIQEPDAIFPYANTLQVGSDVANMIFETLLELNENGQYQARLAREVPTLENGGVSSDGLTYTLRLRDGVSWHDGTPFRAEDVRFTWEMVTDPNFPAQNRTPWAGVESIEAPDDYTAVIRLTEPDAAFPYYLATSFIVPSHLLRDQDVAASQYFRAPVGTGPFVFQEWIAGTAIRVAGNSNYWKPGLPYLDQIIYETIPSSEGLMSKIENQDIHIRLAMNFQDQEIVREFPDYTVVQTPSYSYWNFRFNCEDPILSDVRVRQALACSIDKEEVAQGLMFGLVEPLWTWITPVHWAHNPAVMKFEYDPDRAMSLLDEAGWIDSGGGNREKDGHSLSLRIVNIAGDVERLQMVQVVQQYWAAVGVRTEIEPIQAAAFGQIMETPYQVAYNFAGHDFEVTNTFWLRAPRNWPRYQNPKVLDLMRQANATQDRDERRALHFQWQELMTPDQPELLMFMRPYYDAVHRSVAGFKPNAWGRPTWNVDTWWLS